MENERKLKKLEPFQWLAFYQLKADELGIVYFKELKFLYFPDKLQFILRQEKGALVYMELTIKSDIHESNFLLTFENSDEFLKYFPKFETYEKTENLKYNNFYNVENINNVKKIYKEIIVNEKNNLLTEFLNPLN
jgi:hypothetical protein